jgi:hypothetical protein
VLSGSKDVSATVSEESVSGVLVADSSGLLSTATSEGDVQAVRAPSRIINNRILILVLMIGNLVEE